MNQTTEKAVSAAQAGETDTIVNYKPAYITMGVMLVFYVGIRIYEQYFGWKAGLDSFAPEFQTYWMNLMWTELPLEFVSFCAIGGYLWKTRDRNIDAVAPREEMRRILTLIGWLAVYAFSVYWGASYFTEQDGTWHQTVIRDTDFTPSHILEFYLSYPIYIICGWGAFMYAHTRIPQFAKRISLAFLMFFAGPFMIFPNIGLNEWGHTFWFMEELFTAPLHWGFVFFGWFALAVFGVARQVLDRVIELSKEYEKDALAL
ncbi:MAG TPA: bacterial ammonia monooxygenase, subunit AmoC [Methylocystis sp.]